MTVPTILFGTLIGILIGALFHIWRGGGVIRLILFVLFSSLGFWVGHLAGAQMGFSFLKLGNLQIGTGIIGAVIALFIGLWLTSLQKID